MAFRPWRLVLLTAASLAACAKKADPADPAAPNTAATDSNKTASTLALPVVGEPVRRGDLVLTVNATGQIRTDAASTLKAETAGTVKDVLVRPGDAVIRGQVLVRLDPKPLDLDVRSAQAALGSATVTYNSQIVTDSLADKRGVVRPERRAFLKAQSGIDGAQIALEKARLAREHADIIAPFDGVIESVGVAVGDHVNGNDIATVVDLKDLRVEAQVLEHDLPLLHTGGEAWVTIAARSGARERRYPVAATAGPRVLEGATDQGQGCRRMRSTSSASRTTTYTDLAPNPTMRSPDGITIWPTSSPRRLTTS